MNSNSMLTHKKIIFIHDTCISCHLSLLQFKYLITIDFLLCLHITNIIDMPMGSVAYVQKGFTVSDLAGIWH